MAPYSDPERTLERLRLRHGAPAHVARRLLPLLERASAAPPDLQSRLIAVVDAALARDAIEFAQAQLDQDERCLTAIEPLLDSWLTD